MLELFLWLPVVFVLGVLGYASLQDVRSRQVSNWIWVFSYPIGGGAVFAGLVTEGLGLEVVCFSLSFSVILGLVLFGLGFYGGADVKALIFVGLTAPLLSGGADPVFGLGDLPLVLGVFCNSALLTLVWPLSIFVLNLKDATNKGSLFEGIKLTLPQKVGLLFTARKLSIEKLHTPKYLPAEQVILQKDTPTRVLVHFVKAETDLSKYLKNIETNGELYQKGVLVSPTIPSICFLTSTLATMILYTLAQTL